MHNVFLIRRRFPNRGPRIIATLFVLSLSALLVGMGLLLVF